MELLAHQASAIEKLRHYKVGALFMEQGTGKTRPAIELIQTVDVDYIHWLGPYQSIHRNDGTDIVSEVAKWKRSETPIEFTGIESLSNSDRILYEVQKKLERAKNPFLVVDESLKIKNWDAKRTKRIIELGKICDYKLILNGTPISRNLLDVWAQMEFLSPLILNMSSAEFKNTFCEYTRITKRFGGHKQYTKEFITKYHNIDHLYSLIRHYVFETDLSLSIHQQCIDIDYSLDDESKARYEELKTKYLDNEKLQYLNNNIFLEMTQKMQHVYCVTPEKIEMVKRLFRAIPQSETIIACKFVKSQEVCKAAFPDAVVLSLQKESLSLNMQHCNNLVFFDKTFDWGLVDGMKHRIWRTGQTEDCRFYNLNGNVGLESLMQENNDKKEKMLKYFKAKTLKEML